MHSSQTNPQAIVKGFAQEAALDFDETFAPVIRIDSVRTLFAISAVKGLYIIQADIKNAFLHSNSDFQIYVQSVWSVEWRVGSVTRPGT